MTSRRDRRRLLIVSLGTASVMIVSALAAWSGQLSRFDLMPPPMMVMIVTVLALSFGIGLSPFGRNVASEQTLAALIGLQAFRLPLELVMHHAGNVGIMPVELSYGGYSFDIVTGAAALILFVLLRAGVRIPSAALWTWNAWGYWCLAVIIYIAVATSPIVRAFGDDPRHVNTWVLFFPYVWLPVVLVTIAISGHLIITRALLARSVEGPGITGR
jgi:hypothetical protein